MIMDSMAWHVQFSARPTHSVHAAQVQKPIFCKLAKTGITVPVPSTVHHLPTSSVHDLLQQLLATHQIHSHQTLSHPIQKQSEGYHLVH